MNNDRHQHVKRILGGVSFLDTPRTQEQGEAVVLKQAKKSTAASTLNDLLEGIETQTPQKVEQALAQIKEKPGTGWTERLLKALVSTETFNTQNAELLCKQKILTPHFLHSVMESQQRYSGYAWLFSDPKRVEICKSAFGRENYETKKKSLGWIFTKIANSNDLDTLSNMNIGKLLEGEDLQTIRMLFNNLVCHHSHHSQLGSCLDQILATSGWNNNRLGILVSDTVAQGLHRANHEKMAAIERALRSSQTFTQGWEQYWNLDKDNAVVFASHLQRFTFLQNSALPSRMPIDFDNAKDPLEMMLAQGNEIALDALTQQGDLSDAMYQRLKHPNSHLVHLVISRVEHGKLEQTLTHMMAKMGWEWKDSLGRGWGHCLVQAASKIGVKNIQNFMRDPHAAQLLMTPDHEGKTAIEALSDRAEFQEKEEFIMRCKRNLMNQVAQSNLKKVPSQKRPKSRLAM